MDVVINKGPYVRGDLMSLILSGQNPLHPLKRHCSAFLPSDIFAVYFLQSGYRRAGFASLQDLAYFASLAWTHTERKIRDGRWYFSIDADH